MTRKDNLSGWSGTAPSKQDAVFFSQMCDARQAVIEAAKAMRLGGLDSIATLFHAVDALIDLEIPGNG